MIPQEKARELVSEFLNAGKGMISEHLAYQCAKICVQQIIDKHYDDWSSKSPYWNKVMEHLKNRK